MVASALITNTTPAKLATIGAKLAAAIDAEGLRLLECDFADPLNFHGVIEQFGVGVEHFRDDLEVLWLVAQLGRKMSSERLFGFARKALRQHHWWDDTEILGNYGSGRWCDAKLKHLFGAMFPNTVFTEHHARRLLQLHDVRRRLESGLIDADRLLWPPTPENWARSSVLPSKQNRPRAKHSPVVFTLEIA